MAERARRRWPLVLSSSSSFFFFFLLAALSTAVVHAAQTSADICTSAEFWLLKPEPFGSSPLTIKTLVKGEQVCLEFALSPAIASGAGWVAVGISRAGKMVSSPFANVMLFQASVGSLESYVLGGYSKSAVVKANDQSGYVVSAASVSTKTFSYQRTLRAATTTDIAIDVTKDMKFIWAYGASWPISGHKAGTKGTVTYRFKPETVTVAPTPAPAPAPIPEPTMAAPKPGPTTSAPEPAATEKAPSEVGPNSGDMVITTTASPSPGVTSDGDANASATNTPIATVVATNETFTLQPTTKKPNVTGDATLDSDHEGQGPIFRVTGPFCNDERNCPAIVGGIAFLFVSLCGLLTTWLLYSTAVGRLLLHQTLAKPPVPKTAVRSKSKRRFVVANPWMLLVQTLADLKVGEALVVLTFLGAVASLVVLNLNAQESEQVITGQVALLTLMFLLLPVARIPLWSIFFGSSFERIIKFHRWLGMALTVAVVVHLIQVLQVTTILESAQYGEVVPLYGFIACLSFVSMALLANEYIRRRAYELFYISHRVLAPIGLVFAILHAPKMIGTALAVPLGLYVAGVVIQWTMSIKSTFQANISSVNHHQTATLVLRQTKQTEKLAARVRPGAFFWVKLPSVSRTQWHPFSAIVTPNGKSVGFCVKAMGDGTFTRRLVDEALKKHVVPVSLSGPFGNLSLDVDLYDVVVVVAGGVGITPMVSLINQKRNAKQQQKNKAKTKSQQEWLVVWSVQSSDHLLMIDDFMPSQQQQSDSTSSSGTSSSNIQDANEPIETGDIAVTAANIDHEAPASALSVNWAFHVSTAKSEGYVTRQTGEKLVYKAGRPSLSHVVSSNASMCFKSGGRVAVLACGPPSMTAEAQALARTCHFDFHKEVFSW